MAKIAQSNQPHAPSRRRRFYLAVRWSVGLHPPAAPPDVRKHENTRHGAKLPLGRSGDKQTVGRSSRVRWTCASRVRSLHVVRARRSSRHWSTGCRIAAVSLQRVRATSRDDDRRMRFSAQPDRLESGSFLIPRDHPGATQMEVAAKHRGEFGHSFHWSPMRYCCQWLVPANPDRSASRRSALRAGRRISPNCASA
jgi:hypothetical protein